MTLIYADGSCLNCNIGGGRHPAFTSDPSLLTYVSGGQLVQSGIDGLLKATILGSGVSDAVWSGQGLLAVVRAGHVWAGKPGPPAPDRPRERTLVVSAGGPDRLCNRGWVMVARLGHKARRLMRGGAPAWSPDGNSIAFIDKRHDLRIVAASGGHARRVGHFRARSVDWQPVPATPPAACVAPPGSKVIASAPGAVVTSDTASGSAPPGGVLPTAYMGCLTADGRERLLESFSFSSIDYVAGVSGAAVAGNYAALINSTTDPHYGGSSYTVGVYDLRTSAPAAGLGGESTGCPDYNYNCYALMDGLVLGIDGFSAVHTQSESPTCPHCEQIVAADSAGIRTLDSVTTSSSMAPALTGLTLSGDTLTWQHSGTPESAQLH